MLRCSNATRYKAMKPPGCGCDACNAKWAARNGKKTGKTLREFILDKKREGCRVCALPPDVLEQVRTASSNKIPRTTVVEWLGAEYGEKFTSLEFDTHFSGRH